MRGSRSGFPGRSALVASLAAAVLAAGVSAQQQGGMMKEVIQSKLAAIKQSSAANQAALRQYTWIETVQFALKGEVKATKQMSCRYGPDGKVAKTPIGPPPEQPKAGPLKRRIVEQKKEEITEHDGGRQGRHRPLRSARRSEDGAGLPGRQREPRSSGRGRGGPRLPELREAGRLHDPRLQHGHEEARGPERRARTPPTRRSRSRSRSSSPRCRTARTTRATRSSTRRPRRSRSRSRTRTTRSSPRRRRGAG